MNIPRDILELIRDWKDIEGFEGLYQVSRLYGIKSLNYRKTGRPGLLKPSFDKGGYMKVVLYKNKKPYPKSVHRLVAEAFIPNPNNLPMINHRNEQPSCNFVWNLEWCTNSYNQLYGTCPHRKSETVKALNGNGLPEETKKKISKSKKGKHTGEANPMYGKTGEKHPWYGCHHTEETKKNLSKAKKGSNNVRAIKIRCVETGEEFDTITEAEVKYSKTHKATGNIGDCLRGNKKTAYGLHFEYI